VPEAELAALGLDYKAALGRAFDRLEEQVLRQSRHIGCRDGSTVTSVLVTHDTIYCANTGDSRSVLCRDNNAVALSTDHKPSSDDERQRIVAAGGEVRAVMLERAAFCCFKAKKVPHGAERLWPGGFSVSRAVGDIDYKDLRRKKASVVNGPFHDQSISSHAECMCAAAVVVVAMSSSFVCVAHSHPVCFRSLFVRPRLTVLIHRPDITVNSINPRDQFIICGSDGLWDVLTNQQAVEFVLKELKKRKAGESVSDISQKLADHAYSLGSEDNITALIMWFANNELPFKQ
jgi:serine/threonine protein phosphatase PrpC